MAAFFEAPAAAPRPRPGLSLLVVEDDEADTYLIGRALADNPAVGRVVHARDGAEALAMVERGEVKPDLAFVDLHMPLMNGFQLLLSFANRSDLNFPVVVLTSSSAPNDAARCRLRRAVRVITKPDTVADMRVMLAGAIEQLCRPGAANIWRSVVPPPPGLGAR
jgi:CheY-like chemotaxis protein